MEAKLGSSFDTVTHSAVASLTAISGITDRYTYLTIPGLPDSVRLSLGSHPQIERGLVDIADPFTHPNEGGELDTEVTPLSSEAWSLVETAPGDSVWLDCPDTVVSVEIPKRGIG